MARGDVPRALGADRGRAGDSAALESWRLRRGVSPRAPGAGRRARRSAPAATVARRLDSRRSSPPIRRRRRRARRYRTPRTLVPLGRTPLDGVRIPRGHLPGADFQGRFQPIEGPALRPRQRYRLDPVDAVPPGMVRVAGGRDPVRSGLVGDLDDFWIDRFEVTNRQFKEFVDHGGYRSATTGGSRSSKTDGRSPWDRPSSDSVMRPDGRGRRPGRLERIPTAGRFPGRRRELVRGGGVRGVRRQEPADVLSLVPRGGSGRFADILPSATSTDRDRHRSAAIAAWVRSAPTTWPAT